MRFPQLDHDEYEALVTEAGYYELLWVQVVDPGQLFKADWAEPEHRGLRIQLLNVTETYIYRTRNGHPLFVVPDERIAPLTYDFLQSIWPEQGEPWAFIVRENQYDELDESIIYFRYGEDVDDGHHKLPEFELGKTRTH